LFRVGLGSLAAGGAAFAFGFAFCMWVTDDAGLAGPASSAAVAETQIRNDGATDLANVTPAWQSGRSQPMWVAASFSERFTFEPPDASLDASPALASFDDRFGRKDLPSETPVRIATASPPVQVARAATAAAAPRPAARATIAQVAPKRAPKAGFQLASASETTVPLAYAPADSSTRSGMTGSLKGLTPKDSDLLVDVDTSHTAIYDIRSHTVYLPNGRRLEAHSGLGSHMDDPRSVAMKNTGVTPPNIYELKMRESLFHGVQAIRLIPTDESKMYGRAGILAHSYMLGPNGQSNGCVSFGDYQAFLDAYLRGDVTRIVVVERLADAPSSKTASDWFANTLKDIFRRS
jgi:Tlde1 domain